jgi:uncharacterized alpha-E superfamily protein
MKANRISQNLCEAFLTIIQWGKFTRMRSKGATADHVTTAWLAKICKSIDWYRKIYNTSLSRRLVLKFLYA